MREGNWYAFVEAKLKHRNDSNDEGDNEREFALERGESWVFYHLPQYNVGIQVGRQSFKDKREWWWDADLDAIRVRYANGAWSGQIALAREVARVSSVEGLDPEEGRCVESDRRRFSGVGHRGTQSTCSG